MALRLLIVDDNQDSADSLALLLKREGFDVQVAYGGPEAIEVALRFQPQALIVDLAMPIMDGFQVAKILRATPAFQNALFVALTGLSDQSYLDEASKAQFDEYLLKPPNLSLLRAILSEAIEQIRK